MIIIHVVYYYTINIIRTFIKSEIVLSVILTFLIVKLWTKFYLLFVFLDSHVGSVQTMPCSPTSDLFSLQSIRMCMYTIKGGIYGLWPTDGTP